MHKGSGADHRIGMPELLSLVPARVAHLVRRRHVLRRCLVIPVLVCAFSLLRCGRREECPSEPNPASVRDLVRALGSSRGGSSRGGLEIRSLQVDRGLRNFSSAAIERVVAIGEPAVPELLRLLDDGGAEQRRQALVAVGLVGPAARIALPKLTELADTDRSVESETAVLALACVGRDSPEVVEYFARRCGEDSPSPSVVWAVGMLGTAGVPLIPDLVRFLEECPDSPAGSPHDLDRAMYAAWALGGMGAEAASAVQALADTARRCPQPEFGAELGRIGSAGALAALRELLTSGSAWLAESALRGLYHLGPASAPAAEEVAPFLLNEKPVLRGHAASVMKAMGPGSRVAQSTVLRLLASDDATDRRWAVEILHACGDRGPDVLSALRRLEYDPSVDVRTAVERLFAATDTGVEMETSK